MVSLWSFYCLQTKEFSLKSSVSFSGIRIGKIVSLQLNTLFYSELEYEELKESSLRAICIGSVGADLVCLDSSLTGYSY